MRIAISNTTTPAERNKTMTKYDSNEQYELDRANWLYHLDLHKNEGWDLDSLDVVDVFNLLKQSKWIGNVDDVGDKANALINIQ